MTTVADTFDLDRLAEAAVVGAPPLTHAQIEHLRTVFAPHLHLFAQDASVTELPRPVDDASRRAAA